MDAAQLLESVMTGDDRRLKNRSMRALMTADDAAITVVIAALSELEDSTIYWALDGVDYSEEMSILSPGQFNLIQDTIGFRKWRVLAYAKILIAHGKSASNRLISLLGTESPGLNALIAFVLGEIGDKDAIPALISRLAPSTIPEKIRVIQALGRLRSVDAVEHLHSMLAVDELTFVVAVALGRIEDIRSAKPLAEQFRKNRATAHATGAALAKLGQVAVEPLIQTISDSNSQPVHEFAAELLGLLGDERAIPALLNLLQNTSDHNVRHRTIEALGKLKAASAIEVLTDCMLHPLGLNDRSAAIVALASIDYDAAFNLFTRVWKDTSLDHELRAYAVIGYSRLGFLHDIQPLIDAAFDPDARIRSTAVVQLANMLDERSRETLEAASRDPDWHTRVWAKEALIRMGPRD